MDQKITGVFFEVVRRNDGVPLLEGVLNAAFAAGATPGDRQLPLSEDVTVRLERLEAQGEWIEGEFTRVQVDNIPHEAMPDGLHPSRAQSQGHSAVFRYMPRMRILVIQKNLSGMTYSRFFRYLRRFDDSARYDALPVANADMWERFGRKRAKRLSVTFSSVANPRVAEGPVGAITQSTKRMADALEGPTVHIAISAGGREEGLNKGALRTVLEALTGNDDPGYEVTSLSVSAEDEEGEASEVINFLDDVLKEQDMILLNGLSSQESYERRIAFLRDCYARNMDYIVEHYDAR